MGKHFYVLIIALILATSFSDQVIHVGIGEYCTSESECLRIDTSSICIFNTCNCRDTSTTKFIGNKTFNTQPICPILFGRECLNDTYLTSNAECVDGKVRCKQKTVPYSLICIEKKQLNETCYVDEQCTAFDSKCTLSYANANDTTEKRCICSKKNVTINGNLHCSNENVGDDLNESCKSDDNCKIVDSICYNNECFCRKGYKKRKYKISYECIYDAESNFTIYVTLSVLFGIVLFGFIFRLILWCAVERKPKPVEPVKPVKAVKFVHFK